MRQVEFCNGITVTVGIGSWTPEDAIDERHPRCDRPPYLGDTSDEAIPERAAVLTAQW